MASPHLYIYVEDPHNTWGLLSFIVLIQNFQREIKKFSSCLCIFSGTVDVFVTFILKKSRKSRHFFQEAGSNSEYLLPLRKP